jgi:hypothetical protein
VLALNLLEIKKKEFDHSMDVKAIDNNLYNKNEYINVYILY